MNAGTFAAVFAALYAGHMVGDHIVQTDAQAAGKTAPTGWWKPMTGHLLGYHLCMAAALGTVAGLANFSYSLPHLYVGFVWSWLTHCLLDRRWPVRWLLRHTGSDRFADLASGGMNGPYLADQSLHIGCLFIAALIIAGGAA